MESLVTLTFFCSMTAMSACYHVQRRCLIECRVTAARRRAAGGVFAETLCSRRERVHSDVCSFYSPRPARRRPWRLQSGEHGCRWKENASGALT